MCYIKKVPTKYRERKYKKCRHCMHFEYCKKYFIRYCIFKVTAYNLSVDPLKGALINPNINSSFQLSSYGAKPAF